MVMIKLVAKLASCEDPSRRLLRTSTGLPETIYFPHGSSLSQPNRVRDLLEHPVCARARFHFFPPHNVFTPFGDIFTFSHNRGKSN